MDFDLNDDQRLLQASISRLVHDHYDFGTRKQYLNNPQGWSRDLWSQYAMLGLLGLPFSEADGGFGGGPIEVMIVMQALGHAAILEPFLSTVILGGAAIRHAAIGARRTSILSRIISGHMKLAFAHEEAHSRYDFSHVTTTAERRGGAWVLEGSKSNVLHGDSADAFIVSARTAGTATDPEGITLFLLNADAAGITRRGYTLRDGSRVADVCFASTPVDSCAILGEQDAGFSIVSRVIEAGISAISADTVGAIEEMFELTVEYVKTRAQFGKTIGSFQAVQHRLAEMYINLEQARSMAMFAAMAMDEPDIAIRAHNISMAKVGVGQASKFVSQQSIQLHGGIGMTDEYAIGHLFRRVMVAEHTFGDTAYHLSKVAARVS